MQPLEKKRLFRYGESVLFLGFFFAALILCMQISYSDGDDAYFYNMAHSMPLFEYLKMRYIGWEGRMTSEAMTYIAFWFGKTFWQFANAIILTLLPAGLIHMIKKMTGEMTERKSFFLSLVVYLTILSLGITVIGYGAFWITGSTFYLWSIVAGIWAAMPFVELVYGQSVRPRMFWYAIPCGFIAAMGQEQIAAVVIAFGALAILCYFYRERRIAWLPLLETAIMITALVILFISPGTAARSQAEIEMWMPQYDTMSLGNHIFITVQWMLSSFANEGKMLFFLIWVLGACLLLKKEKRETGYGGRKGVLCMAVTAWVFAVAAVLPYLGIHIFSEMGMGVTDITQCVDQVSTPSSISLQNWLAIVWWLLAIVFTVALMWKLGDRLRDKMTMGLMVLAACASEAIMFFSPTMYASGARVFFMSQILLWLLVGWISEKLLDSSREWLLVGIVGVAGVVNFISGVSTMMSYIL